jgi:hypothetical protein
MWWFERQERAKASTKVHEAVEYAGEIAGLNDHLLDVVRGNTEALVALREELHSQRLSQTEWMARIVRGLEHPNDGRAFGD